MCKKSFAEKIERKNDFMFRRRALTRDFPMLSPRLSRKHRKTCAAKIFCSNNRIRRGNQMIVGNQKRFWFRWNCNGIMSERDVYANKLMAWLHK